MNTKIKTALNNTFKVFKTMQESAWQSKLILAAIVTVSFVCCKNNKEEEIHYRFPNRIDAIEGERSHITDITYKIGLFESNDNSTCPMDSIIVFRKDGKIFNSQREIGYWKKDGTLYLNDYKKRFFFNWITPEDCASVQLFSIYTVGSDKDVKKISIYAKDVLKKEKARNGENEFGI